MAEYLSQADMEEVLDELRAHLAAAERRLADLTQDIRKIEHDAWQLRSYVQCDRPRCGHVGPTDPEIIQAIRSRAAEALGRKL